MSLFGVEVNHQVNRIITETRLTLQKQKFIPNLRTLYRSFAQADQNISGVLPPNLFEKVVQTQSRPSTKTESSIRMWNSQSSRRPSLPTMGRSAGSSFCKPWKYPSTKNGKLSYLRSLLFWLDNMKSWHLKIYVVLMRVSGAFWPIGHRIG